LPDIPIINIRYRDFLDTHFSIVFLGLEFKLNVETQNLGSEEMLGLLLETSIRKRLLEGNTVNKEGVLHSATNDLLHSNHVLIETVLIQMQDRIDTHLGKEWFLAVHNFGRHCSSGAFLEQITELGLVVTFNVDCNFLDLVNGLI
jgi:hypothetical protein